MKKTLYSNFIKHLIDFFVAFFALILLSPLLLIVIILQIFFNGFPLFFIQKRVGKNGKIFNLIKFRTMNKKKDKAGILLPDYKRKTYFGSFLRATSIDELPSIINILKGDMSLIGPRPLLVEYLKLYNETQKTRHNVRPGLTGLAQVNGRNGISWQRKFDFDVKYIKNISFTNDLKIFLKTIFVVFARLGINASSSQTAEKFNGKN
jgi:lipopolysaccharide/colanic/teichoic acid biosynthesis glycosyltransferase